MGVIVLMLSICERNGSTRTQRAGLIGVLDFSSKLILDMHGWILIIDVPIQCWIRRHAKITSDISTESIENGLKALVKGIEDKDRSRSRVQ